VAALTEAITKEVREPDEERLRDLARKLGTAKKEIMAMDRSLVVGQPANLATEAHELASEAGEAIRASREMIKAALRGMGVALDISEANGPTGAPRPPPVRPALGSLATAWAPRGQLATPAWPPQSTPTMTTWPPPEIAPRPRTGGAGDELTALMQGLMGAQANDSGWPTFSGKYVEYPRFRKEWWAYRQTYHGHMRDKLVCRSLKEKSLASCVKMLVNDIDDLQEAWSTLDTCFDQPEKYIAEALDPVIKFRSYKAFDNGAIREFYSLLRAAVMGARKAGLLHRLVNDQTLPSILTKMPPTDWRQWAREQPTWMREAIEEVFWNFVDQKWRDALNMAVVEPPSWGTGSGKGTPQEGDRRGMAEAKKLAHASVHVTGLDGKRHRQGDSGRRCIFAKVKGGQGTHPPWYCKVFEKIQAKEREKIIEDNQLCLLHDKARPCGAKQRPVNPTCHVPNCKGKHIRKLHKLLKDVFKEENQVHLVQGDDEWEESEEAWDVDGEGEAMIVGTIQREDDCSWQDASKSWLEQDEEEEHGTYHVGTCQGASSLPPEAREKQCSAVVCPPKEEDKDAETAEDSWWTPGPEDLQIEGGEKEYFLELLMRESALNEGVTEELTTVGSKTGQQAKKGATRRNKAASNGGKRKGSERPPREKVE
jgi:hypothetical protein